MSNLSTVQFTNKDWNPFVGAANFIDKLRPDEKDKDKQYSRGVDKESHTEQESSTEHETPALENTEAPTAIGTPATKRRTQGPQVRKQGPINPSTTGAPMPRPPKNKSAIHPITGAQVPRVPMKPRGAKPTAPGTRPKKK
jgi:hypothetical protein